MAENSDQTLHFNEYFKVIRNRLWVIFTIFLLTVLSGTYVTNEVMPKIYTAVAQIQIGPDKETSVAIAHRPGGRCSRASIRPKFQPEYEVMQSPDILLPIIGDLGSDKIWGQCEIQIGSVDKLPPDVRGGLR